ncbi:vitamin K epoxide reductase family protein [uncultured Prevotella sp.]|mgnify:FL=1|uniref:vitamin K epoxide reductase family protein n=1 Tax=uncultured Prevotella sp. TaxID=159272 RepID=UPI00262D80FE|nr:vitamin K epoxide reductase family protein [uncultured Prevotella sp.]
MNILSQTIIKYIRLFVQGINENDIRIFLESSPQYPNLLSVVQTLQYANLQVGVGQCDWDYLKNLDSPFLLHIALKFQETLMISKWDSKSNCLKVLNPKNKKWETKDKKHIEDIWDGVIIYTNSHTAINNWIKDEIPLLLLTIIVTIVTYTIMRQLDIIFIYFSPIIIGVIVSLCIYWRKNISKIGVIEKICHKSSITDCDAVENSYYGVWKGFSMNNMALSFFISQLICIILSLMLEINNILNTVYLLPVIVLIPITIYSVYGQIKVKKICPLCLIVLICVFLEALLFVWIPKYPINMRMLVVLGIINVCILYLLQFYEHFHLKQQEQLNTTIQLLKLKRKPEIILLESSQIEIATTPMWFGKEDSSIIITTIISPSCKHCRKVVSELLLLIEKEVQFRWNVVLGKTISQDSEKIKIWVQEYISDKDFFLEALHLWSNEQIQDLQCVHPKTIYDDKIYKICNYFNQQIEHLNISKFPQIFLNRRLLSPIYTTSDLKFIISDMLQWK